MRDRPPDPRAVHPSRYTTVGLYPRRRYAPPMVFLPPFEPRPERITYDGRTYRRIGTKDYVEVSSGVEFPHR